jgi:hypothetical protein
MPDAKGQRSKKVKKVTDSCVFFVIDMILYGLYQRQSFISDNNPETGWCVFCLCILL